MIPETGIVLGVVDEAIQPKDRKVQYPINRHYSTNVVITCTTLCCMARPCSLNDTYNYATIQYVYCT